MVVFSRSSILERGCLYSLVLLVPQMLIWEEFVTLSHCSEHSNSISRSNTLFTRSIFPCKGKRVPYINSDMENKKESGFLVSDTATAKAPTTEANNNEGLLQVPCSVTSAADFSTKEKSTDLTAYVDTGATHTIIFYDAIKRSNLLHLMDRNPSFLGLRATSAGGEKVQIVGRIPAGLVTLVLGRENINNNRHDFISAIASGAMHLSPEIYVLRRTGVDTVDLLLGLDVLNLCKARICLQSKCLILNRPTCLSNNDKNVLDSASLTTSFLPSITEVKIPFMVPDDCLKETKYDADEEEDEFNNKADQRSSFLGISSLRPGFQYPLNKSSNRSNRKSELDFLLESETNDNNWSAVQGDHHRGDTSKASLESERIENGNENTNISYCEEGQNHQYEVVDDDDDGPIDFSGM